MIFIRPHTKYWESTSDYENPTPTTLFLNYYSLAVLPFDIKSLTYRTLHSIKQKQTKQYVRSETLTMATVKTIAV